MSTEITQRWDNFLNKIKERFNQLMAEAEQGCLFLLDSANLDPIPMSNAWGGIKHQFHDLTSKIDDTWQEKVENTLEEAGLSAKKIEEQHQKGEALEDWMEGEFEAKEIKIFAEAARKIYAAAKEILTQTFPCKQCTSPLPVPEKIFRSVHVTCSSCNTVNTFEPGAKVRAVEYFCSHYLAMEAAYEQQKALNMAEKQKREAREETEENHKAIENALITYWTAYLKKRIEIIPEYAETFEEDLKGKLSYFYNQKGGIPVFKK